MKGAGKEQEGVSDGGPTCPAARAKAQGLVEGPAFSPSGGTWGSRDGEGPILLAFPGHWGATEGVGAQKDSKAKLAKARQGPGKQQVRLQVRGGARPSSGS